MCRASYLDIVIVYIIVTTIVIEEEVSGLLLLFVLLGTPLVDSEGETGVSRCLLRAEDKRESQFIRELSEIKTKDLKLPSPTPRRRPQNVAKGSQV